MNDIEKAIEVLNHGGIVIFPTDTAYGIGCRMDDEKAVKKLYEIRNRPETQPAPVLVSSIEMAQNFLDPLTEDVKSLMLKFWPGALTIVYLCKTEKVPILVRGGSNSLGVRMPDNKTVLEIIRQLNVPILGPSANFHREQTPYLFKDLNPGLVSKVDYVIKKESENADTSQETSIKTNNISTVLDCSQKPFKILRQGRVIIDNIM